MLPEACEGNCHAVFVEDVARAAVRVAQMSVGDERIRSDRYVVTGPEPVSWRTFFEAYAGLVSGSTLRSKGSRCLRIRWSRRTKSEPSHLRVGLTHLATRLRRVLGEARLRTIRDVVRRVQRLRGPILYWPRPDELKLYGARGTCDDRAIREDVGCEAVVSFSEGVERIRAAREDSS